ncbi:MAG: GTP-binding protein [Clostridia bacterium]|nr:GTP-binding protein [Clostridia bacterium]
MTKIDIFSGFLGAGKTTLIKKLIKEGYKNEQLVLIENEFGEIGIDGGFLKEAGIQINEMNSGCICCSLVGDFRKALTKVLDEYHPNRIIIEPSGVGKLSDVINAVKAVVSDDVKLNSFVTVADATKCKIYMKNFGEFYNNQIENASTIILSRTQNISDEKLEKCLALIREHNDKAAIVTTPWDDITGEQILAATDGKALLSVDDVCHNDDECCDHDHEHHHHHDDECCDHDHEHHHNHHADEVFTSWGKETARKYTMDEIKEILSALSDSEKYGTILRAKGIVPATDGKWIHYDFVPEEMNVRNGSADYTGRICVIGSKLNESELEKLFKLV